MQRRLGRRDVLLLTVVCVALVVLAIQLPFASRGFDHPQAGIHWKLLEAPGRALGWGGVALLIVAIPYALVAWLKGRSPGRTLSALGALVFGIGVGGLAGVLASTPMRGGGIAGGALAHMLSDSLGSGFAGLVLAAITIPGLFLSLAPLLLDTGPEVGPLARTGPVTGPGAAIRGGAGGTGLPAVLVKPWYPERRVGADGEELPMSLGGTDVGPIRYRDPPPTESTAPVTTAPVLATAPAPLPTSLPTSLPGPKASIPKAMPPPPVSSPTRKPPVISGVRYVDEAPEPAAPLTQERSTRDSEADDALPDGVRFAPSATPVAAPPPAPAPMPTRLTAPPVIAAPPPPRADESVIDATFVTEPSLVAEAEPLWVEPARVELPPMRGRDVDVVAAWVTANPLPTLDPVDPSPFQIPPFPIPRTPDDPASDGAPSGAGESVAASLHPSVVGHRKKLAESGIFEGTSPAADQPGRPPKPKPRPAAAKDWREALHGLFSSLPVEELPPIRVPDDLVGRSAEEEAALRGDAPGQMKLFDASDPAPGGRALGTHDALFDASVDAALERGTASLVLLKRKLGVGYARAASLMDALVAEGVLGEMTASGSRPTLLTQAEWNRRKKRS